MMYFKMIALSEVILLSLLCTVEVGSYKVALVEYLLDDQLVNDVSPLDLGNRNAKKYDEIVRNITSVHHELDLAIFPEAALVREPLDTNEGRKGMTFVPEPSDNIVPCNSSSPNFSPFFKRLSCTARKYQTYLVVNLKEIDNWQKNYGSGNGTKFYNTNVVFDRDGKVIARYRKYNLFLEQDTNIPSKPELVTFETDFGETFGIFTCFDILFESPSIDLVRKGIKNFIFPALWGPELPFLTTIQVQQMWAQGNDVNLLTANAVYPKTVGGLGIFLGNRGVLGKSVLSHTNSYVLYKDVVTGKNVDFTCTAEVDDKVAEQLDNYKPFYQEDLSEYYYVKLNLTSSNIIEETLCQENGNRTLCCNFRFETKVDERENKHTYEYFLVVRSGFRFYGRKIYRNNIEVCAIVACTGPNIANCAQRFPDYKEVSWPVSFTKMNISAEFENCNRSKQFPNSLLADFSPISPSCTTWKTEVNQQASTIRQTFLTNVPVKKLLTFAIFGRNYNLDDQGQTTDLLDIPKIHEL